MSLLDFLIDFIDLSSVVPFELNSERRKNKKQTAISHADITEQAAQSLDFAGNDIGLANENFMKRINSDVGLSNAVTSAAIKHFATTFFAASNKQKTIDSITPSIRKASSTKILKATSRPVLEGVLIKATRRDKELLNNLVSWEADQLLRLGLGNTD